MADQSNNDYANWMSKLPESLLDCPITELAIPGSHNSFSAQLDSNSEVGPGVPPVIHMLGPLAKGIMYKWSVTQTLSFKDQLKCGIRYLDLRIASRKTSSDIYFIHGLYGTTVAAGIKEILHFLEEHKREIVILDFNHFYEMNEQHHRAFLDNLINMCGEKLCLFVGMENLNLRMMWENGLQIIVLFHHQIATEYVQIWPGSTSIVFPWANTISVPELISYLDKTLMSSPDHCLHVSQGVLTPNAGYILGHMNGSLKNDIAMKTMPELVKWFRSKTRGKQNKGINIVTADFIELSDFVKSLIQLNYE
ncbi:PI-PLC X domain-containing protein 2 [Mactra antiquata]